MSPKETEYEGGSPPPSTTDDARGDNENTTSSSTEYQQQASSSIPPQWVLCGGWNEYENLSSKTFVVVPTTDLFRKFASSTIPLSAIVVEIGCANGFCTKFILRRLAAQNQYLGIDISPQFIRECQAKYPEADFELINVMTEWGRAEHLIASKRQDCLLEGDTNTTNKNSAPLHMYVDIGGNRDVESLLALLQIIQHRVRPDSIIVKSQELFSLGTKLGGLGSPNAWKHLQAQARETLQRRRHTPKKYNPLRLPQRYTKDGVAICRYHNYDSQRGCLRFQDASNTCPLDHDVCHSCLTIAGHVAWQCPLQQDPLLDTFLSSSMPDST